MDPNEPVDFADYLNDIEVDFNTHNWVAFMNAQASEMASTAVDQVPADNSLQNVEANQTTSVQPTETNAGQDEIQAAVSDMDIDQVAQSNAPQTPGYGSSLSQLSQLSAAQLGLDTGNIKSHFAMPQAPQAVDRRTMISNQHGMTNTYNDTIDPTTMMPKEFGVVHAPEVFLSGPYAVNQVMDMAVVNPTMDTPMFDTVMATQMVSALQSIDPAYRQLAHPPPQPPAYVQNVEPQPLPNGADATEDNEIREVDCDAHDAAKAHRHAPVAAGGDNSKGHTHTAKVAKAAKPAKGSTSPARQKLGKDSCQACRKSKTKCVPVEGDKRCQLCIKKNRACVYGADGRTGRDNDAFLKRQTAYFCEVALQWHAVAQFLIVRPGDLTVEGRDQWRSTMETDIFGGDSPSNCYRLMTRPSWPKALRPTVLDSSDHQKHSMPFVQNVYSHIRQGQGPHTLASTRNLQRVFVDNAISYLSTLYRIIANNWNDRVVNIATKEYSQAGEALGGWWFRRLEQCLPPLSAKQQSVLDEITANLADEHFLEKYDEQKDHSQRPESSGSSCAPSPSSPDTDNVSISNANHGFNHGNGYGLQPMMLDHEEDASPAVAVQVDPAPANTKVTVEPAPDTVPSLLVPTFLQPAAQTQSTTAQATAAEPLDEASQSAQASEDGMLSANWEEELFGLSPVPNSRFKPDARHVRVVRNRAGAAAGSRRKQSVHAGGLGERSP